MTVRYACMPRARLDDGPFWIEAVQPEHIEAIRLWRNAQIDILRQAAPLTPEQQERYYAQRIWPGMSEAAPADLLVSYLMENRLIGYGGLVHLAWEHKRGEVSFLLDPQFNTPLEKYDRLFRTFLGLIKRLAFEDLGLLRLTTEAYAIRPQVVATLEDCGFRREGVLRQHVLIDGRPVDSILQGCLKADAS